jgi:hypothetical protein
MGSMTAGELREWGLRPWNDPAEEDDEFNGAVLWLLPGEWYEDIPEGLEFTDIANTTEAFTPGVTDNDIRFGCLAFGVLGPDIKAPTS